MERTFNLVELARILLKWKKPLAIVIVLGAIGSVVVALLLPNYYRSTAVFYPTNPSMTDRQVLFSTEPKENYVEYFGTKKDVERVLTIAKSAALANHIIEQFNLYEHYDIDPEEDRYPQTAVAKEFNGNYSVKKTELAAIEISMLDKDREMAAQMVEAILTRIDEINKQMIGRDKQNIMAMFEEQLKSKQKEVDERTDSLAYLAEIYNIRQITYIDGENHYYTGTSPKGIEEFKVLQKIHENAVLELNTLSMLYHQYQMSATDNTSSLQVVERPAPAEKKAKPVRWLICVVSTISITFFSLIGVVLAEKISDIKAQLEYAG